MVVIFITDGRDNYSRQDPVKMAEYAEMMNTINSKKNMSTRFMTIGFSQQHNAELMNTIANYGTQQGNFIFVDSQ